MLHALWGSYSAPARRPGVDEAELDMNRGGPYAHGHRPRLWEWLGIGKGAMDSPRRSVDRELQEDWPIEY